MKWTQFTVIICLAFHQACTIQAYVIHLPEYSSLGQKVEEKALFEDDEVATDELSIIDLEIHKPAHRSISSLDRLGNEYFATPKIVRKVIEIEDNGFQFDIQEEVEDYIDQSIPFQKRLDSHTGAIVPYKGAGAVIPHKGAGAIVSHQGGGGHTGAAPRKGFGRGAKAAAAAGGVAIVGGAIATGVGLAKHHKNKRSQEREREAQLVKRDGKRGGRRKRVAAQNRANDAKTAPAAIAPKAGMGKAKGGLLLAGGIAAGAAAIGLTGGSSGAAPAAK